MLGRKTFLSVISLLFIRLVQGIILIVAVNQFNPIEFGYVTVAQSLLAFFLFFSDLNLSTAHLKLMAEEKDKSAAFSTYFFLKIILLTISSITFIFVISFSLGSNLITNNINQILIIAVIFFDRLVISMLMVYTYSFQATFKIAKKELAAFIGQIFGLIFAMISIFVLKNFFLYLINTTISNVFSLSLYIFFGREFKLTKIKKTLLIKYLKLNLIFVLPFFLNVIITNVGPLVYLQYYNEEILGVYNVIATFFLMIQGIQQVFRSLLIPNYSILLQNNKLDEIRKTIDIFEKFMAILNSIIILIGIIFGDYLLKLLFGQIYFENGLLLYFGFLISLISFSLIGPYSPLIVVAEKFKIYTLNLLLTLIFSVMSWILLIPFMGIVAINLGTWFSIIPQTILIRYYCYKYFKTGNLKLKYALNLLFIFSMISIGFFIYSFNLPILIRICITLIILVLYLGFLVSTKILTREDTRYILSVIHPKKMFDYIKEETLND